MIVRPGTKLIYASLNEDLDGIYIGDVRRGEFGDESYIEVPMADVPQLIKRLRELQHEARKEPLAATLLEE